MQSREWPAIYQPDEMRMRQAAYCLTGANRQQFSLKYPQRNKPTISQKSHYKFISLLLYLLTLTFKTPPAIRNEGVEFGLRTQKIATVLHDSNENFLTLGGSLLE